MWIKPGDYPFLNSAAAVAGYKGSKNTELFIPFVPSISSLTQWLLANI